MRRAQSVPCMCEHAESPGRSRRQFETLAHPHLPHSRRLHARPSSSCTAAPRGREHARQTTHARVLQRSRREDACKQLCVAPLPSARLWPTGGAVAQAGGWWTLPTHHLETSSTRRAACSRCAQWCGRASPSTHTHTLTCARATACTMASGERGRSVIA